MQSNVTFEPFLNRNGQSIIDEGNLCSMKPLCCRADSSGALSVKRILDNKKDAYRSPFQYLLLITQILGALRHFGSISDIVALPVHKKSRNKTNFWAPWEGKETGSVARILMGVLIMKR